ncbi:MAG: cupredoxin domain-containing protein [Nanoarchaeota archaeon]|nr:cupredoxin domain-containing protein [Nanoarchaeota archaeon]
MNKNILQLIIIALLVISAGWFVMSNRAAASENNQGTITGQVITLSMKNGNYYPNTITVKAGQPVTITLDKSIKGCYRSFTIPTLGIQKNLPTPNDALTFTLPQPGSYRFACSMGMGTGTIIAE